MKPLVTALIDTYNHEKYIEHALVSVLEQGLSPSELEIVVVDDGSTDQTPAIIQKFTPRVKRIRKPNGGQASAFNAGFAESTGQIVALLDGDDWWAEGKLSAVTEALEKNPGIGAVGHGGSDFYQEECKTRPRLPSVRSVVTLQTEAAVRWWAYMVPSALTVRRKVFDWIAPIPENMVFMADSAIQAAATVFGTLILPEPLFYYRCHAENLYSFDPKNHERQRRRSEMAEIAYGGVYQRLVTLGVPDSQAFDLVGPLWLEAKRQRLHLSGGTRREALETEMRAFHATFKNPSFAYRLFKYVFVGAAALALPPRLFYGIRNRYAQMQLGNYRERLLKQKSGQLDQADN